MSGWSVIVFAVVTPDLEAALQADLDEAALALEAMRPESDIHVHVNIVRPARAPTEPGGIELWPTGVIDPGDATAGATLDEVLAGAECWKGTGAFERRRGRLLVLWGHGARAFPTGTPATGVPEGDDVVAAIAVNDLQVPDILGYDACLMATVPTVRSLSEAFPQAIFVGSMVPEPASGWPYFEVVRILSQPRSPKAVAAAIVAAYAASVSVRDWCMVALDLAEVGVPDTGLTSTIESLMATDPPDRTSFFDAADGADIREDTNVADLGALMRRLQVDKPHATAKAVEDAILSCRVTRRMAGSLAGRDGIGVRLGVPWGKGAPSDKAWPTPPDQPGWTDYLPEV